MINVKSFGAVGDGIVDDTVAVLQAVASATGPAVLYFPTGNYLISASVVLGQNIIGLKGDDLNSSKILIKNNIIGLQKNISSPKFVVQDLSLNYHTVTDTLARLLVIDESTHVFISNVYMHAVGEALSISKPGAVYVNYLHINNLHIDGKGMAAALRIYGGGGHLNNVLVRKTRESGDVGPPIYLTGQITSLNLNNCTFAGLGKIGKGDLKTSCYLSSENGPINECQFNNILCEGIDVRDEDSIAMIIDGDFENNSTIKGHTLSNLFLESGQTAIKVINKTLPDTSEAIEDLILTNSRFKYIVDAEQGLLDVPDVILQAIQTEDIITGDRESLPPETSGVNNSSLKAALHYIGSTQTLVSSVNIASVTRVSKGIFDVVFDSAINGDYYVEGTVTNSAPGQLQTYSHSSNGFTIKCVNSIDSDYSDLSIMLTILQ